MIFRLKGFPDRVPKENNEATYGIPGQDGATVPALRPADAKSLRLSNHAHALFLL